MLLVYMEPIEASGGTIDIAKPRDAEGINEVRRQAWLKAYPNPEKGITVEDIEARFSDVSGERIARNRKFLEYPEAGMTTLVARKNSMIVGVCRVIKKLDRNQLQMIYVHPDFQGQGIGVALWDEGKKYIDTTKDTYVEVADYNTQAIKFYSKRGFVTTGRTHQDEHFRLKSGAIFTEMEMVLKAGDRLSL